MISLCQTELYWIVLYWNKVSLSIEMIAIKLLSAEGIQMI